MLSNHKASVLAIVGKSIALRDYPGFAVLGLFSLFGGVDLALPFLLDQMQIPSERRKINERTKDTNGFDGRRSDCLFDEMKMFICIQ